MRKSGGEVPPSPSVGTIALENNGSFNNNVSNATKSLKYFGEILAAKN